MSNDNAGGPCENTDREIWREREDDYYADSIHVTQEGGIGINCGGTVFVKPVRAWHALAKAALSHAAAQPSAEPTGYFFLMGRTWVHDKYREDDSIPLYAHPPAQPSDGGSEMSDAEIYLRAAERIDSGEYHLIADALDLQCLKWSSAFWRVFREGKFVHEWSRETRVLALCLMAAMVEAK
jgi:hypothetical protein